MTRQLFAFRAATPEIAASLIEAADKSAMINTALKAHCSGLPAPPPELLQLWRAMARDVSGLATNTNQLARAAHLAVFNGRELTAEHFVDMSAEHKALRERLFALLEFWEA